MSQPLRLPEGGRIDRSQPLRFEFDGRAYIGYAGDTLASALIANGVRVTGRSFKYHRPRGTMAAGFEEANSIVQLGRASRTEPNLRATQIELSEGLQARAVNCWPSARFDLFSFFRLFKPFWPAGFYYKTFMAPSWHLWEPAIRHGAGLGVAPRVADPDVYEKRFAGADVIVVGAGPSGIAAALAAARAGASVILLDDKPDLGGSLLYEAGAIEGLAAAQWKDAQLQALGALPNVQLMTRTTAFGYYDHNHLLANELLPGSAHGARQRLWKIRGKRIVMATGALERPLVFPNNDRPGVMLAGAARQYLHRHAVLPGRRIVVATNNDSAYEVAIELKQAGADIALIADTRTIADSTLAAQARALGIEVAGGLSPTDTRGSKSLHAVELHEVDAQGRVRPGSARRVSADSLLVSGGWNPTVHLFSQSGGSLRYDDAQKAFVPARYAQPGFMVGAAAGIAQRADAVASARVAGAEAAAGRSGSVAPVGEGASGQSFWSVDVTPLGRAVSKSWVDLASDSTESDLRLAARENFISVELFKRYTTTGMMTDQGKTSNVNAIGILGGVIGKAPGEVGTTRFRPPFNPVSFGAIAGRNVGAHYRPLRRLPTHDAQLALGAHVEDYGAWLRPSHYPRAGESETVTIAREVHAVRSAVGLLDYSPLGKILVSGPDAATFLQRMYVNNVQTLKVGACRYGLMLGEDGIVKDDGVLVRWSEDSFVVGTTSGQADRIVDWLEEWLQCEWTGLDVTVESITTQWSTLMLAGPRARELLMRLGTGIDLSADAFPHMTAREGLLGKVPLRISRVSFTGELSFEISVPWNCGRALWDRLLGLGADLGIQPFGLESLLLMRVEKGFLHVGSDTDGLTLPQDVGFAAIIDKKKEDFVGRRSTMTPDALRQDRRQLVGLLPVDGRTLLPCGAHIVGEDFVKAPVRSQGWVTSSVYSPTLNKPVAMGLVERGLERLGQRVKIFDDGRCIDATITSMAFYDADGARLRM
ncbi:sarcosine oxidase subunit alpha family protein [Solimonas terrae]|uniref:Sarcosine oxidase subunit alpha family protein n=1 Tax=Solimonas terrae TaxID=1396819 RepID=A0A6M2BPW8_9GAMM|nr:sarcosine oxidase subunit alpha family protein [Solimonas terrae]NGY04129.1 sarcosine oxidase subunit alpha family protein [Solimonas terrae]